MFPLVLSTSASFADYECPKNYKASNLLLLLLLLSLVVVVVVLVVVTERRSEPPKETRARVLHHSTATHCVLGQTRLAHKQ